jgi:hypothetical protein
MSHGGTVRSGALARRITALSLLVALVAGCASSDKTASKLSCPGAFAAPQLDRYAVFRPGVAVSSNTDDIAWGVKLADVKSSCRSEGKGLRVTTTITFTVARNDDTLRQGDFIYFVAVTDAGQNILAKQNFALRVGFAPRQKQVRVVDEITEHLPIKDLATASGYAIIVGLQVSQQQLEFNRERS